MTSRAIYFYIIIFAGQRCGVISLQNSFDAITECVCPQDVTTYQCTVCGGLITVWEGDFFEECAGSLREITLTNRDFGSSRAFGVCNSGAVVGRGLSIENGCYTSQLNITFDTSLQGRVVRCSIDNGTHSNEIGRDTLSISTEPFPPPRVLLNITMPNKLLFSWNQSGNCPSLSYQLLSTNCGNCPTTTDSTAVSCSDFALSNSPILCTFTVRSVICSNSGTSLIGSPSIPIIVNLTVPSISDIRSTPHYNIDDELRRITVTFSTVSGFSIYDGINGLVVSYNITYASGRICGSNNINATSCVGGICIDEFNISSSICTLSSDINVTVFAITNLGKGPGTTPIEEKYQNNFVSVQVISLPSISRVNCTFLNIPTEIQKSCSATIVYGENCLDQSTINGMRDNDNVVIISLTSFLEETMSSKYCSLTVNATANTRTVIVDRNPPRLAIVSNNISTAIGVSVSVIGILYVIWIIVTVVIACCLTKKNRSRSVGRTESDGSPGISLISAKPEPRIIFVPEDCNMIEFAKRKVDNYDPDSGKGYYQFTEEIKEYISPETQIVLVSEMPHSE